jgi:hypothetical protein
MASGVFVPQATRCPSYTFLCDLKQVLVHTSFRRDALAFLNGGSRPLQPTKAANIALRNTFPVGQWVRAALYNMMNCANFFSSFREDTSDSCRNRCTIRLSKLTCTPLMHSIFRLIMGLIAKTNSDSRNVIEFITTPCQLHVYAIDSIRNINIDKTIQRGTFNP